MKAHFKIGQKVYYKKLVPGTNPQEYIIRRGTVRHIHVVGAPSFILKYQVDSLESNVSFVLVEHELYTTQKELLRGIS